METPIKFGKVWRTMRIAKVMAAAILVGSLSLGRAQGSNLMTPMYPHKNGEADRKSNGSHSGDLEVRGDIDAKNKNNNKHKNSDPCAKHLVVSWITYQTDDVNFSPPNGAVLNLFMTGLKSPGTLTVYRLTKPITKEEDKVTWADLGYDAANPLGTLVLKSTDVEKMLHVDFCNKLS